MSDDYYKDVIWGGHKMWKYELSTKEMDMASVYIDNGDFKKINEDTFDYIKSCWYASCTLTKFDFRMGFRHINVMDLFLMYQIKIIIFWYFMIDFIIFCITENKII